MIMQKAATPCGATESRGLERTRFFGQQLVGPDDLTQDQIYFREKMKRHNRLLHGWGVVCGACVRRQGQCEVVIEPGYILGPQGDEIVIGEEVTIDLCKTGVDEAVGCCGGSVDPWCDEGRRTCRAGTVYLAVRYSECLSRPVRSLGGSCGRGCHDQDCEHSRIRDSFSWALLSELPPGYTTPMRQPPFSTLIPCIQGVQRKCPPCPDSPWVVLADIDVASDCRVIGVNCFTHRRYVVSFANYFQVCRGGSQLHGGLSDYYWEADAGDQPLHHLMEVASAYATGSDHLVDLGTVGSGESPKVIISYKRTDGTHSAIPAYFDVHEGETVETFLEREGGRRYFDPATGGVVTLGELYSMAGVEPNRTLSGTAEALSFFEGATIDLPGYSAAREVIEKNLTKKARDHLYREALGSPKKAVELDATALMGVGPKSPVGKKVKAMKIGEIAEKDAEEFVAEVLKSMPKKEHEAAGHKAMEVWEMARAIRNIAK